MTLLIIQPRFQPGKLLITRGAEEQLKKHHVNPLTYVERHLSGDWGDLCESDKRQNDSALKTGEDRIFSSYRISETLTLWIITEYDRSVTTILLPSEY